MLISTVICINIHSTFLLSLLSTTSARAVLLPSNTTLLTSNELDKYPSTPSAVMVSGNPDNNR